MFILLIFPLSICQETPYQWRQTPFSTAGWTCHLLLKYLRCSPSETSNCCCSQASVEWSQCSTRWQSDFVNASGIIIQEKNPKNLSKFLRVIPVFSVAQSWGAHPGMSTSCLRATLSYREAWASYVILLHVAVDGWSIHLLLVQGFMGVSALSSFALTLELHKVPTPLCIRPASTVT